MGRIAELLKDNIVAKYGIIPRNVFFLDSVDGLSSGDGSEFAPFNTLAEAYNACTTEKNDCIVWLGKSDASKCELSAAFDWSKSATHLFGFCPDVLEGKRCRITQLSTATGLGVMFTVSGSNCIFSNIRIMQEAADATSLIAVKVTGQRNKFQNVEFAGIGHVTQSTTGSASLKIDGGAENYFVDCVIGLDTIARAATSTELWLDGAATRNTFKNCKIKSYVSAAGFAPVTIEDSTGIDRNLTFQDCQFTTDSTNKAITITTFFNIKAAITQGAIELVGNTFFKTDGASGTGTIDSNTRAIIWSNAGTPKATATGGIATKL